VAVEDIGNLWNTKQPGYDDTADIQAALKAFLYGSYTYDPTNTDPTQLPNPSLAKHLQGLSDRLTDQEELGIGSDYLTLAQIAALSSPEDGYIAMASDSNGGAVESLYASAFYTNEAPTTDIVDGVLWVDKDSDALDTYVYNETDDEWVRINDLKNIIAAKGDLLVGTAAEGLDNLTVGANGTVLDSTAYVVPPMSGNAGKYLTNDGSTPSWATVSSSSGLTLITSQSFTNSTSVQINNCFSSTYRNYRVMLSITGISAQSTNVYFRYSSGGTPNSSAIYSFTALDGGPTSSPTASAGRNLTATQFECGYYDPGYSPNNQMPYYATMDIFAPYIGQYEKGMLGFSCSTYATAPINTYVKFWSGWCLSNASFDGFQIRPQGADGITGIIRVYGYQD